MPPAVHGGGGGGESKLAEKIGGLGCLAASLHGTDGRRRGKVPGNLGFYNVPA